MYGRAVSAVSICLLIACFTLIIDIEGRAATIVVDDDGGSWANYTNIQDALDNSAADDTIRVYEGVYCENINITERVSIVGNGSSLSVIDGESGFTVVEINKNRVKLVGLGIHNASTTADASAIFVNDRRKARIEECSIYDNGYYGIRIVDGDTNLARNCSFTQNEWYDIYAYSTLQFTIDNCTMYDNLRYTIYVTQSNITSVTGCNVQNSTYSMYFVDSNDITISDCTLDDASTGIKLAGSSGIEVIDCLISNMTGNGIYATYSDIDGIYNSTIVGSRSNGISTWFGSCDRIDHCTVSLGENRGIFLFRTEIDEISYCTIEGNGWYGLDISRCDNLIMHNCTVNNNSFFGIYTDDCDYFELWDTNATGNQRSSLAISGVNATIKHNTLDEGISLFNAGESHYRSHTLSDNWIRGTEILFLKDADNVTVGSDVIQAIILSCTDVTVEDLNITDLYHGLDILHSTNTIVRNSTFETWDDGIYLRSSENTKIIDCDIRNAGDYGIAIDGSEFTLIDNCTISGCSDDGIYSAYGSSDISIITCWINNNTENGVFISDSGTGINSPNVQIIDSIIENNSLHRNYTNYGMLLSSWDNVIDNVTVRNNDYGMWLLGQVNDITDSIITNNTYTGISLESARHGRISGCRISGHKKSLYMGYTMNFTVLDTSLDDGLFFAYSSTEAHYQHVFDNCTIYGEDLQFIENASNMTIDSESRPIYIVQCNNISLTNANISGYQYGLLIVSSEDISVNNCTFSNSSDIGIFVHSSDNTHLDNCTSKSNTHDGIRIIKSDYSSIKNSMFSGNGYEGISIYYNHVGSSITNCTSRWNRYGIMITSSTSSSIEECSVYENEEYGVRFGTGTSSSEINRCMIYNNSMSGDMNGLEIGRDSNYNNISNCSIWGHNGSGISIHAEAEGNQFNDCWIHNNSDGILLYGSGWSWGNDSSSVVWDCIISNNSDNGIEIEDLDKYLFIGCTINSNANDGVNVENSWHNSTQYGCTFQECVISDNGGDGFNISKNGHAYNITNCSIYNNTGAGINLNGSYNHVLYNEIFNNGINLRIGTWMHGNVIHHNNFMNGTNTYQAIDNGYNNDWDNGSAGNYWSDYNGTDGNGDGVGDTSYEINGSADAEDRYPLMKPVNTTAPEKIPDLNMMIPSVFVIMMIAAIFRRRYR